MFDIGVFNIGGFDIGVFDIGVFNIGVFNIGGCDVWHLAVTNTELRDAQASHGWPCL